MYVDDALKSQTDFLFRKRDVGILLMISAFLLRYVSSKLGVSSSLTLVFPTWVGGGVDGGDAGVPVRVSAVTSRSRGSHLGNETHTSPAAAAPPLSQAAALVRPAC